MNTQLEQFRQQLYQSFNGRADALMDLLDALAGNTHARSVVELSLNPCFRRCYSSLHDSIDNFFQATCAEKAYEERQELEQILRRLVAQQLPVPKQRRFWLFGLDVTPAPRPFAMTLQDRTFVHQPRTIPGNKPITIGHQYSVLVALPEKESPTAPSWVVPLSVRRVPSQMTGSGVGAEQTTALLQDKVLPFHTELCVEVVDSAYSAVTFLGQVAQHDNLVIIARLRGNRTLYRVPMAHVAPQGHPLWYGERFDLQEPTTWGTPDQVAQTDYTTQRGRHCIIQLEGWNNILMRGKNKIPMHRYPFTLIRILLIDADNQPVFQHPLWLLVMGAQRQHLCLLEASEVYRQRYDIEHFFRFGKQKLLMASYQTPEVEHEESWWQIVQLAYVQLWLARALANTMLRPWERQLVHSTMGIASPAAVQRDFGRIIRQIGTPAVVPKYRGKSSGRCQGVRPGQRQRHSVIKKGVQSRQTASRSP